jgi:hypothetical protein
MVRENAAWVDASSLAKLKQAANLANENCDCATKLAQKLSAQLREAQSRISQLELEADGLADRMSAKLQSDANARLERAKEQADARIARVDIRRAIVVSAADESRWIFRATCWYRRHALRRSRSRCAMLE